MNSETKNYYFQDIPEKDAEKAGKCEKFFAIKEKVSKAALIVSFIIALIALFVCFTVDDAESGVGIFSTLVLVIFSLIIPCIVLGCDSLVNKNISKRLEQICNMSTDVLPAPVKLPMLIRMYCSCTKIIDCQSISLVDLKASLPDCSAIDMRTFRECIQFMCKHRWFKHGSVVGGMLCLTESAAEDCRSAHPERKPAEKRADMAKNFQEYEEKPLTENKLPDVAVWEETRRQQKISQQAQQKADYAAADSLEGWREPDEQEACGIEKYFEIEGRRKYPRYEFPSCDIIFCIVSIAIITILFASTCVEANVEGWKIVLVAVGGILVDAILGVVLCRRKKAEREIQETNRKERESFHIRVLDCTVCGKADEKSFYIQDASGNQCVTPYPVRDSFYELSLQIPGILGRYTDKTVFAQDFFCEDGKPGMQDRDIAGDGKPFLLIKKEKDGETIGSPWLIDKERVPVCDMDKMSGWRDADEREKEFIVKRMKEKKKATRNLLTYAVCFLAFCVSALVVMLTSPDMPDLGLLLSLYLIFTLLFAAAVAACGKAICIKGRILRTAERGDMKVLPCHFWAGSGATVPVRLTGESLSLIFIQDDNGNVCSRMFEVSDYKTHALLADSPEFPFMLVKIGDGENGRTEFLLPAV